MKDEIQLYNDQLMAEDKIICDMLAGVLDKELKEAVSKIWHAHPVWFLDGNPIAGYSKQKRGIRLMFWSGADFEEDGLNIKGEKFKDASIFYNNSAELNHNDLERWI